MLVAGLELSDQEKILAVKTEVQSKMLSDQELLDEEGTEPKNPNEKDLIFCLRLSEFILQMSKTLL